MKKDKNMFCKNCHKKVIKMVSKEEFVNRCRCNGLRGIEMNSEMKGVFMGSMARKRSGLKRNVVKGINKTLQER